MRTSRIAVWPALTMAAIFLASPAWPADFKLSGNLVVPPSQSSASGYGSIDVSTDGTVSGSVTVTDMTAVSAELHLAEPGRNGPLVGYLTKTGDNTWTVVAGARLSPPQINAFRAGALYVTVSSIAYKQGELRGQIVP
ncbi:CHRD domain-containing protein [Ideonella sp. YS5]|uniref:CHRD domain-containing protein n=1 Tax=Ideonella sp. YS5 TaxID=3453714 RepID=UPI003EEAB99A